MFFRFLIVGGLGFIIDAGLTYLFIHMGLSPLLARPPAIALAMVFTWLANRHFSFKVSTQKSATEALSYAVVGCLAALFNYGVYTFLVVNLFEPFIAIVCATGLQTGLSFFAYRYFVFDVKAVDGK